jgi:hypothetical protein
MTFGSRSVFFSVLCFSLMSFSCVSKSSQLESKIYDLYVRKGVSEAIVVCNDPNTLITKQKLSEAQCEKMKDGYSELWRKKGEEKVLEINKTCQEQRLSEDDCNKEKEQALRVLPSIFRL